MGRIFNVQNTSQPTQSKAGRLFKEPLVKKESLGSKVVEYGKELAKDALGTLLIKPAQRTTEAITRTLAPKSLAAKGYEEIAKEGGQEFNLPALGKYKVPTMKAFGEGGGKQIAGEVLKTAAYLAPYRKIASTISAAKFGTPAITTAARIRNAQLLGEVGSGIIGGAAFSAGGAMEAGLSTEDIAKQTALGAGLGGVVPLAIGSASRLLRTKPKIPPPETGKIEPRIKPKVETRPPTTTPTGLQPELTTVPEYEARVKTPEFQKEVNKIYEEAKYAAPDEVVFESTTDKQRYERIHSQSDEHINNVLKGTEKPVTGTNYFDYLSVAESRVFKENDRTKMGELLAIRRTIGEVESSKVGQELGSIGRLEKMNPIEIANAVLKEKEKTIPGRIRQAKTGEVEVIKSKLKNFFDNFKDTILTKDEIRTAINKLADDIVCH